MLSRFSLSLVISFFSVITISIVPLILHAEPLSESALFHRCYAHLTGRPVPRGQQLMKGVRAGNIKAADACAMLIDSVTIDPASNKVEGIEANQILRTFYGFHRSWFTATSVEQIQAYGEENSPATRNTYDATEPSLAVTRAVFAKDAKYSDILTLSTGVTALRQDDPSIRKWKSSLVTRSLYSPSADLGTYEANLVNFREFRDPGNPNAGYDRNADTSRSQYKNLRKIQVGELSGIRKTTEVDVVPNVTLSLLSQVPDLRGSDQPQLNYSFDMHATFGGGILGTPIFLMLNYGHPIGTIPNGSTKLPRRWSKMIINTFMCSSVPNLRESDVTQYLITQPTANTAPFRMGTSCIRCHATLDPMAYTARNLVMVNSDVYRTDGGSDAIKKWALPTVMVTSYKASQSSTAGWPAEPVENFHLQYPSGRLYMRTLSGDLLDKSVNSIAELGSTIANTDDFYQCATKRYFEYLTGISVALFDVTDPEKADLKRSQKPQDLVDRKFIEELGKKFRSHQSVKTLVKDIIRSDYYRDANFRP